MGPGQLTVSLTPSSLPRSARGWIRRGLDLPPAIGCGHHTSPGRLLPTARHPRDRRPAHCRGDIPAKPPGSPLGTELWIGHTSFAWSSDHTSLPGHLGLPRQEDLGGTENLSPALSAQQTCEQSPRKPETSLWGTLTRFTSGPPEFPYCGGRGKCDVSCAPNVPEALSSNDHERTEARGRVSRPSGTESARHPPPMSQMRMLRPREAEPTVRGDRA